MAERAPATCSEERGDRCMMNGNQERDQGRRVREEEGKMNDVMVTRVNRYVIMRGEVEASSVRASPLLG